MIRTLRLENYRSFRAYELRDLARVNLLVGPNNCGNTSILEAVHLLVSQGDPRVLIQAASRRGELHATRYDDGDRAVRYHPKHQFHGHRVDAGTRLRISSDDGLGCVQLDIEEEDRTGDLFEMESDTRRFLALRIRRSANKEITLPLAEDGSLHWTTQSTRRSALRLSRESPPSQFVTAAPLDADAMAKVWDRVLIDGRESDVIEAMRILQADLTTIHFLTGEPTRGTRGSAGIVLGFRSGAPRVPIGSYGDGMRRLLALSLSLVQTAGGFLLIDEIDTGLHWTAMEEMWRLVVETALKSSIQVFATSHSFDCIAGLASVLRVRPDLSDYVSIQKTERNLERSVAFDSDDILTAADLSIELR